MDKKNASDFTENMTESLKEALEKITENEDVTAMKESVKEVADVAADFIRKYPIQTVVAAVAVGYILGSLTTKRK